MSILDVMGALLGLVILAVLAWWGWRVIQLRTRRGSWFWQRAILRIRAVVTPGPRGDVIRMRLRLQDNVAQTRRVVNHRDAVTGMSAEMRDVLPSLKQLAAGVDDQLRLWQTEPIRALVADALPPLLGRAEMLIAQAVELRMRAIALIEEADRRSRTAAEEELRCQLKGAETHGVEPARLAATNTVQGDSRPPTSQ
jgi:hypothetical protein